MLQTTGIAANSTGHAVLNLGPLPLPVADALAVS